MMAGVTGAVGSDRRATSVPMAHWRSNQVLMNRYWTLCVIGVQCQCVSDPFPAGVPSRIFALLGATPARKAHAAEQGGGMPSVITANQEWKT